MNFENILSKTSQTKRENILRVHSYEASRIHKFIDKESRMAADRGWGLGLRVNRELVFNEYRLIVGEDEMLVTVAVW